MILYGDRITDAMKQAMDETKRRRDKQRAHNRQHNIQPKSIIKPVKDLIEGVTANDTGWLQAEDSANDEAAGASPKQLGKLLRELEKQMYTHAKNLEFESAAAVRDRIKRIREGNFLIAD